MATTKIYRNLEYGRFADHVICNGCDTEMLVPIGTDICPECGTDGCMRWHNEEQTEVDVQEFTASHKVEYKEAQHILNEQYIKNALRRNGNCIDLSMLSLKYGEDGITDIELIAENEEDDGAIIFHTEDGDAGTLDMLNSPDQLKINEYIISTC